ncbi:histone deacetylase complex protein [Pluteus cervinus]|uniref:Histone deacetylase complex protein n=1 Tax=Pluteus cervinus TaxID=181527 RepID=A0ACD3ALW5_9AGAR|nr:histone deacetylase complex protein [Pluteus cervinus]
MEPELDEKHIAYIVSQDLVKASSRLPSNRHRSMMVHSLVSSLGLLSAPHRAQVINPTCATYKDLATYHSRDYLDYVLNPQNSQDSDAPTSSIFGIEDDCPPFPGLPAYVEIVAGATLTAVKAVCQGIANVAICWDGGRHHARKAHASGFCYVADCILGLMALKKALPLSAPAEGLPPKKARILYLDLDLHFSDAVSEAFQTSSSYSTPQILTLSIHHHSPGFFPSSPLASLPDMDNPEFDPFTLSIPLKRGASDATYARIWTTVEALRDAWEPDCIVVQCGVDGLAGDPCATFNWSLGSSEGSLSWCLKRVLTQWPGKKILLGGGYHSANAARAWAYITSLSLGNPLDLDTHIPDHHSFPQYEPSFTLDIPSGNMQDLNTEADLQEIESCYHQVISRLRDRLSAGKV